MNEQEVLFEIRDLSKHFVLDKHHTLKAVSHVSLSIARGETVGLVGESGCGKTTLGRTLKRLYCATSGEVFYKGQNIFKMNKAQAHKYAKEVQMIFQDPYSSLNPRMTVREIIREGMTAHSILSNDRTKQDARIHELLEMVGLNTEHADRFPHEFSGGQRQRIGVARALAVDPEVIICDEPTSALDVSIQAQVVNLLKRLQKEFNLTLIFISHNLSLVKYISDRIGVMYLGSMVELAPADRLYETPSHPYTEALMSAIPIPDPQLQKQRSLIELEGDIPSPINTQDGTCSFLGRCPYANEACKNKTVSLQEVGKNHLATCDSVLKREAAAV
ncbi:MAG: oligopeptide/dipeptide ABC transporter ATP-binding protein [Angelakisella sp.]|nr:oligopeptide/dipeptide ABC transporter ATP-binding protein [Angelakisella sp.]